VRTAHPPGRCATAALQAALLLVPLTGALLAFLPVTRCYFHLDDFLHLVAVNNHPLATIALRPFNGHLYAVPRLVYAALFAAVGPTPAPFFWLLLALHLINVGLFYRLVQRLTDSPRMASIAALAWGSSVCHTLTLSWFCLHAHVLVGLALLLVLNGLTTAQRTRLEGGWQAFGWTCLVFGAALSFGTGLVLALTFPFLALLVLHDRQPRGLVAPLALLPVAVLGVYALARSTADVTDYDRLGLGLRASLTTPWSTLSMWGHCALYALSALGSIAPGLPPHPAPAGIVGGGVLALLLLHGAWRRSPSRQWIRGLVIFAAACYAVTAVALAHERKVFGQSAMAKAQDQRFHYAPSIALAVAVALALRESARRLTPSARVANLAWAASTALLFAGIAVERRPIDRHDANRVEVEQVLQEARLAAVAVPPGATVPLAERPFRGGFGLWPSGLTTAGIFTLFHPDGELDGRPIRYRAARDRPPLKVAPGSPLARIVVGPPPAPTE
jgi:hypothetical protein